MEITMTQKQEQTLSPQMIQSMKILQMGAQDLLEYIEETVQENPVLEMEDHYSTPEEYTKLKQEMEWLKSTDIQNCYYNKQDTEDENDPIRNYGEVEEQEETLLGVLVSQLQEMNLRQELYEAAVFLASSLNAAGWMDEELSVLAVERRCSVALLEEALHILQTLEPSGIAARNLNECLRIQLLHMKDPLQHIALLIVDQHLEAVAKYRYGMIAKKLRCREEEVREACDLIRTLNPRPGEQYSADQKTTYITPDLIVAEGQSGLEPMVNDDYFPSLKMSGYYTQLMQAEESDQELKEYLLNKAKQAKWVVRSIEQRRSTLLACAQCIIDAQKAFFEQGVGHLVPLTLGDVARKLEIHESTVSRALKDKYMQCTFGVYPMTYFFSRAVPSANDCAEETSAANVKLLLKKLIDHEEKEKPLSDQKLCELLEKDGCAVSRRTVAKYREEMNIPSTSGRRIKKF